MQSSALLCDDKENAPLQSAEEGNSRFPSNTQMEQQKTPTSPRPLAGEGAGERVMSLKANARYLRSHMTDAESKLWYHLRSHRLASLKFKRQKPIGAYIVDFVCMQQRLIIELDGSQHLQSETDKQRDAWFAKQGFRVLRFWDNDVLLNLEAVLEAIYQALFNAPSPLTPLPQAGEGNKCCALTPQVEKGNSPMQTSALLRDDKENAPLQSAAEGNDRSPSNTQMEQQKTPTSPIPQAGEGNKHCALTPQVGEGNSPVQSSALLRDDKENAPLQSAAEGNSRSPSNTQMEQQRTPTSPRPLAGEGAGERGSVRLNTIFLLH